MRTHALLAAVALVLGLAQCRAPGPDARPAPERYDAWLECPGGKLRFDLELERGPQPGAFLGNGAERIRIPVVELEDDGTWLLSMPHYDSQLRVTAQAGQLEGSWTKVRGPQRRTQMVLGGELARPRAPADPEQRAGLAALLGRWRVQFSDSGAPAVGVFERGLGGRVRGTFLTELGDYRFLAGEFDGEQLELSCFDGAHAFLFRAALTQDGSLRGDFWSRDSWHETWTAVRADDAELADPFGLSSWTSAVALGELAFPDLDGKPRRLDDEQFAGRARLIQLFGSWCPNCHDEAPYLAELDRRYRARGLSILGLAFELTGDLERDTRQVQHFIERHGIEYPILVAGLADKQDASRRFPLLDRVRAYPTTIFLDAEGNARAVHTGFAGPATGPEHERLREEFERLIEELLEEPGSK